MSMIAKKTRRAAHDTVPAVKAAGVETVHSDTAQRCICPSERSVSTPDFLRKFRHAQAPPTTSSPAPTHGLTNRLQSSAREVMQSQLGKHPLFLELERRREDIYRKECHAPLGISKDYGYAFPECVGMDGFKFGTKTLYDQTAKELVFPDQEKEEASIIANHHRLHVLSHSSYNPGEQKNRHYKWPKDYDQRLNDMPNLSRNQGIEIKSAFSWQQEEDKLIRTRVESKRLANYRQQHATQLGRTHRARPSSLTEAHAFGLTFPSDEYKAGDLVQLKGSRREGEPSEVCPGNGLTKKVGHAYTEATIAEEAELANAGRVFGIPSIRSDIQPPKQRSVSDWQNYGDELAASDLMDTKTVLWHQIECE